jgi:DNA repair exonuclease SbcCD ATPase subunit
LTDALSREDKERILRALESDREFRYALMGLLGFREILDRITRIEERQQKLEERQQKLEERFQKLEKRMIELEEELVRVRRLSELNRRDIGALTESLYTRWVWGELRDEIRGSGERIVRRERNFVIDDREIDLLVETDHRIYVVEVKNQPNHHDVEELAREKDIVEKRIGKKAIPVLAGVWIGDEVRRYAREKGVRIYINRFSIRSPGHHLAVSPKTNNHHILNYSIQ